MRLLVLHPALAKRDCEACQNFMYANQHSDKIVQRGGKPVRRPAKTHPPCRYRGIGCPKGTPEQSRALNARNAKAYRFHKECEAVGRFPDDPIVRANALVIRQAEQQIEQERQRQVESLLTEIRDRR